MVRQAAVLTEGIHRFDIASGSSAPEQTPACPARKDPGESVDTNYDAKSTECHRGGTSRDPVRPPQRSNLSRSARPLGQRWLGLSEQFFWFDKWIPCRGDE